MEHVQGRSINLALSIRGKAALDAVALKDYVVDQGVPMYARLVHNADGTLGARLPYGQPGEVSGTFCYSRYILFKLAHCLD
jgi:kynurenine 3-monooxygenase